MEGDIFCEFGGKYRNFVCYLEVIRYLEKFLEIFKEIGKSRKEGYLY